MVLQTFPHELAGDRQLQRLAGQGEGRHVGEPHHDGRLGQLGTGTLEDDRPHVTGVVLRNG